MRQSTRCGTRMALRSQGVPAASIEGPNECTMEKWTAGKSSSVAMRACNKKNDACSIKVTICNDASTHIAITNIVTPDCQFPLCTVSALRQSRCGNEQSRLFLLETTCENFALLIPVMQHETHGGILLLCKSLRCHASKSYWRGPDSVQAVDEVRKSFAWWGSNVKSKRA